MTRRLAIVRNGEFTGNLQGGFVAAARITILNNGSLRVEGDFEIVDQQGNAFGLGGRTSVTLCRCGHSGNQPFCDGTHKKVNFTNVVNARDLPPLVRI